MPVDEALTAAHKHCTFHREEILRSDVCGCFHCCEIFASSRIVNWTDNDSTAVCPFCSVDSVIGCESGFAIEADFLRRMHDYWFSY
jgi:hypothetical protein